MHSNCCHGKPNDLLVKHFISINKCDYFFCLWKIYEQVLVWYGFMLVESPLGYINLCFECACWILEQQEGKGVMAERSVEHVFICPRSITMKQLYGRFDPISHEWSNGWCFREQNRVPVVKTTNHFNYIFMRGLFYSAIFLKGLQFDFSDSGD